MKTANSIQEISPYKTCLQFCKFTWMFLHAVVEVLTTSFVLCNDIVIVFGLEKINKLYHFFHIIRPFER